MATRAAIASTDGIMINCHFGKARKFLIVEFSDGGFQYVESRGVSPCCNQGDHEDGALEKTVNALSDCKIILVSRIGIGAAGFLESRGFEVYESPFLIEPVLKELASRI